ncbi:MAG: hypothetical protein IPI32_04030 [Austwickia sp.]|nr:hypothetical protein [Austwickia sp.]
MKISTRLGVLAAGLMVATTACSGDTANKATETAKSVASNAASAATGASSPAASPAAATPSTVPPSPPAGQVAGQPDTAKVAIKKCVATATGIDVQIDITNPTKINYQYVIGITVKDAAGKVVAGVPIIGAANAGATAPAKGSSGIKAKGKISCSVGSVGAVKA